MSAPAKALTPERVVAREITSRAGIIARLQVRRRVLNKKLADLDVAIRNNQKLLRELVASQTIPFPDSAPLDREEREHLIDRAHEERHP